MKAWFFRIASCCLLMACLAGCSGQPSPPKEMVYVPGGRLEVGVNGEVLIPPIKVESFFMDRYEVTNERFNRCLRQGQCKRRERSLPKPFAGPKQPAVMVDFHQAWALCRFEGKRLASEIEWAYTIQNRIGSPEARAGNRIAAKPLPGHRFSFPVGSVSEDQTAHGLYDMGGNVAEIVAEAPDPEPETSKLTKLRSTIIMGGSFLSPPGETIDNPRKVVPDRRYRAVSVGFRCARDIR